jgi:invasion protein IalB
MITSQTKAVIGAAAALALAAGGALAQQKAPASSSPPPAAKSAAPAPAAKGAAPASSWVKLCEKAPFVGKGKDGKDVSVEKSICLTHHERLDAASGMVLISAAIREIEGAEKRHLMVMLPLGMAIPPGVQAGIYTKDMWDKIQKGEKVDDTKLTPVKMQYMLCHGAGCTAETEATAELVKQIQGGAGLIVYAVNGNGQPIAFPVPLNGFSETLAGPAADNKAYSEKRQELMKQIFENQKKIAAEYAKQQKELQGMTAAPAGQKAPAQAQAPATQKK